MFTTNIYVYFKNCWVVIQTLNQHPPYQQVCWIPLLRGPCRKKENKDPETLPEPFLEIRVVAFRMNRRIVQYKDISPFQEPNSYCRFNLPKKRFSIVRPIVNLVVKGYRRWIDAAETQDRVGIAEVRCCEARRDLTS